MQSCAVAACLRSWPPWHAFAEGKVKLCSLHRRFLASPASPGSVPDRCTIALHVPLYCFRYAQDVLHETMYYRPAMALSRAVGARCGPKRLPQHQGKQQASALLGQWPWFDSALLLPAPQVWHHQGGDLRHLHPARLERQHVC